MKYGHLLLILLSLTCSALARENLYPRGDLFPIGGYISSPARDLAAGFTLAGPSYGKQNADEVLAQCEALGMPFIYSVGLSKRLLRSETPPTVEEIRETIAEQVRRVAKHDLIYAWYLTPEELRYWQENEIEYLKIASETIRETDPKKRPVWMYEPGHRTREDLMKTFSYQQIAGKGIYTNYSGWEKDRAWVRWTFDQQQQAIDAVNPGMLAFAIPEMFRQPSEESLHLIASWVRHDCYTALLEGAEGIVVFSFAQRGRFPARAAYYEAYAGVARELTGDLKLGTVFLRGEAAAVPGFEQLSGAKEVEFQTKGKNGVLVRLPALRMKGFTWSGSNYFFLVNSSSDQVSIRFNEGRDWRPLLHGQASLAPDRRTLELEPWGVAAFQQSNL